MASRGFQPSDLGTIRWASDAQLSPDGEQLAWVQTGLDLERDRPVSNIMVAPSGGGPARRFTPGPDDGSPRWSPDGRHLAYLSIVDDAPALHLAPLAGGVPLKVDTPGPVGFMTWAPSGGSLVLVVNTVPKPETDDDPRFQNAAKLVRGMASRVDGRGYLAGRDHLFVYELEGAALRQLTSGDYDHASPCWSPDGTAVACLSDRSPGRHDDYEFADLLLIPVAGGRRVTLASRVSDAADPRFSPDGKLIAFVGVTGPGTTQAGRNARLLVVPTDRSRQPAALAEELDRPVIAWAPAGNYAWVSNRELLFKVADRGTVSVQRARVGEPGARPVIAGDLEVTSFTLARRRGRLLIAFTTAWVDRPGEVYCLDLDATGGRRRQISQAGQALAEAAELLPAKRHSATAPDGTKVEYLIISPRSAGGAPPMFMDIHGGPHAWNPMVSLMPYYQALAAAGYAVVLPNPRGSLGYGEEFATKVNGDVGGDDYLDLLACADDAIRRGLVDPQRQLVGGYSYGGYMSAWIIGHTDRFRAAAIGAPVIDFIAEFGASDVGTFVTKLLESDPWQSTRMLQDRSPLAHIPNVNTPVFLYVFEGDLRCPPDQADALFNGLRWHGKEVEYVRYPGGSHLAVMPINAPPSQTEDRLRRLLDFLAGHGGVPSSKPHATAAKRRPRPARRRSGASS